MKYLIHFSGMPGTGKTTTSLELKRIIKHSVVISRNSVKEWFNDFKNNNLEEKLIYAILIKSTDIFLSHDYSVIVDGAGWSKEFYNKFKKIAQKNNARLVSIRLNCKTKTSIKRTSSRKKEYVWDRERLENFKNIFEEIPIDISINSEKNNPNKILRIICKKIKLKS